MTEQLLKKLFDMGIINTQKSLQRADRITCICHLFGADYQLSWSVWENGRKQLRIQCEFVEQGQVRIGPNVVTIPAFLVTKTMEDYVTWVDSSKVRRTVQKYNDKLDDFDLL
jgi:U3 small nucleolar ribonucleoprotein protein IMP3